MSGQKCSHQFTGRYQVIALMLFSLLLLAGQKGFLLSQTVDGFSQTSLVEHCAASADCHHGMEEADCCLDEFTQCALDCAQVSAWLPVTATRLHLQQVRAVPPPLILSLPEPLTELPYQPPRLNAFA